MLKRKVLLIDDEPDFIEMIQMRLEANGYDVHTALGGEEGIEKAKEVRPNLILLDVMMPGTDGMEVLHKLRLITELRYVPVIMLTAKRESRFIMKADELGATDYIMKPCDSDELLKLVRKHA